MSVRPEQVPRSKTMERWGYAAAAPLLAVAPNVIDDPAAHFLFLGLGVTALASGLRKIYQRELYAGQFMVRISPLLEACGIDVGAMKTDGWTGWCIDVGMALAFAGFNEKLLPIYNTSRSKRLESLEQRDLPATDTPELTAAPQEPQHSNTPDWNDFEDTFEGTRQYLWARAGYPGDSKIVRIVRHQGREHDFTLLLHAREEGRPISNLTEEQVAAAFQVDVEHVEIYDVKPMPGQPGGPGWKEVQVIPDAKTARRSDLTDADWWNLHVGNDRGPIPGTKFLRKGRDARGFTYWHAKTKRGVEPRWSQTGMCEVLGINEAAARVHLYGDGDQVLVQVWDESPLARTYIATRELLMPDAEGRYIIGYLENGQPARTRVYTPRGAAHGMFIAPSGGGKSELMVCTAAAYANWGAVVMVAAQAPDEKMGSLAPHVAAQGVGGLYMLRFLRMLDALMSIRGDMVWADGKKHDWSPKRPGCPYRPLAGLLDEYLSATNDELYGKEIAALAEDGTIKGRKYGIGLHIGAQSAEVQDGFSRLMRDNIRENSNPVLLRTPADRISDEFGALGFERKNIPDPLPRTFAEKKSTGRLDRIIAGEAEPPEENNTGGVGWFIEGNEAPRLRTLLAFTDEPIARLFPDFVNHLTDHEIRELTARGVWFDWTLPPQRGEFGYVADDEEEETTTKGSKKGRRSNNAAHAALAKADEMFASLSK